MTGMRDSVRTFGVAGVALLLLTSCGSDDQERPPEDQPTVMEGAGHTAEGVELPETASGEAAGDVLEIINAEQDSTESDWEGRLAESFTEEVSAEELAQTVNSQFRPVGPWTAVEHEDFDDASLTTLEAQEGQELEMQLALDEDGLIEALFFAEPREPVEPAEGFEEIDERLTDLPGEVHAVVVQDDETLLEVSDGEAAPLASVAKLYVVLALVEAVDAGEVSWDDTLEVTDQLRSLPSGTLQDQPAGYETTVFDVAQRMIQISDNTGTDMLIDLLGRDAVEQAVADSGHQDPSLMEPFPSTREMFQLRWGFPDLGEDWKDGDAEERREILEEIGEEDLEITHEDVAADDVDFDIDWYATPEDLTNLYDQLFDAMEEHPELDAVLASNPGLTFGDFSPEDLWWDTLAFKGGSLPGVLNGAWRAQDEDGTVRTVILLTQHEDAEALSEEAEEIFSLAEDALTLEAP